MGVRAVRSDPQSEVQPASRSDDSDAKAPRPEDGQAKGPQGKPQKDTPPNSEAVPRDRPQEDAQADGAVSNRPSKRRKKKGRAQRPREQSPKPVGRAALQLRHLLLLVSFVLCVGLPLAVAAWYLYERAADQYASRVGFSVRAQDTQMPLDIFEGLGSLASSSTSDTDVLYEFIQSQEMVVLVDDALDLRSLYSKPENDPYFAFDPDEPIEGLVDYWQRMVAIYYDSGTGLIELRVKAFTAEDALAIAEEIVEQSSIMINRLSAIAREDSTRYAREELDDAVARLKSARQALTSFRATTQIVDPSADVQGQMTVLTSLQQQLASAYVEYDLLIQNSSERDPRVEQTRKTIDVIQKRIDAEREKFGLGSEGDAAYSTLLARFEELSVDLEFAQTAYLAALANYDSALREAQKQSRYLAAYLRPTKPQSSEFPQRGVLLGLTALFVFLIWSTMTLIYYSVRDRS
jgi:capsular polysaccharide transport system permease protein